MQQKSIATALLLLFVQVAFSSLVDRDGIQPRMRLVATVEGKSFFAESTPKRTKDEAQKYCKSAGLNLASITTPAQYDALLNAYSPGFSGEFWTSGEDANSLRQFNWADTNEQPGDFLKFRSGPWSCKSGLTFKAAPTDWDDFGFLFSNPVGNPFGVLCQT